MTDIVDRLREASAMSLNEYGEADRYREAADEIEKLREALRAVLNAVLAADILPEVKDD